MTREHTGKDELEWQRCIMQLAHLIHKRVNQPRRFTMSDAKILAVNYVADMMAAADTQITNRQGDMI